MIVETAIGENALALCMEKMPVVDWYITGNMAVCGDTVQVIFPIGVS